MSNISFGKRDKKNVSVCFIYIILSIIFIYFFIHSFNTIRENPNAIVYILAYVGEYFLFSWRINIYYMY